MPEKMNQFFILHWVILVKQIMMTTVMRQLRMCNLMGVITVKGPKSRMEFTSLEELVRYYKQYTKQCRFGVMTHRSEK